MDLEHWTRMGIYILLPDLLNSLLTTWSAFFTTATVNKKTSELVIKIVYADFNYWHYCIYTHRHHDRHSNLWIPVFIEISIFNLKNSFLMSWHKTGYYFSINNSDPKSSRKKSRYEDAVRSISLDLRMCRKSNPIY